LPPAPQLWVKPPCPLRAPTPPIPTDDTQTRTTSKYTVSPPSDLRDAGSSVSAEPPQPSQAKAFLTLKTYDPVSGACLKYKTDKAAEVGRLVAALGTCARAMAALPEIVEDAETAEGVESVATGGEERIQKSAPKDSKPGQGKGGATGGGGAGSGGKKRKGRK